MVNKIKGLVKNLEDFEMHHKILAFLIIILSTILIARGIIYFIIDPNPSFFGFEIHHFDYGLILLIITSLLLLLGKRRFKVYLIMLAISLGLIIDQLWFIRKQVGGNNPEIYNPSLIPVILIAIAVVLLAFLIHNFSRKNK